MTLVGKVQMTIYQIAGMVAMRNSFMSAARTVDVILVVTAAIVASRALVGILSRDLNGVMLDMTALFLMMEVPVVQIVDVIPMLNGGVTAALAVIMIVMIAMMTHVQPPFLPTVFVTSERCSSPTAERTDHANHCLLMR